MESRRYRFASFAFAALALACTTSPSPAAALIPVSYDVGDVGPENQGRIPRFGEAGCVDSEPRFAWLTKKVPRRLKLVAEEEVADSRRDGFVEVAPIKDSPAGPVVIIGDRTCPYPGVTCVDMPPSPSDPLQSHVPLDHDGFGHAVGFVRTTQAETTGGGPIGEVGEQLAEIALPVGSDGPTNESIGSQDGTMTVTEKDELVNIVTGGMGVEELDAVPVELEPALPEDELFDAYQAAYFHDGELELLDTPSGFDSIAYAIDKPQTLSDQPRWIVGMIVSQEGVYTAVVWINGTRHPLSEVMTVHSGWDLQIATDLDARGYVLGVGDHTSYSPTERVFVGRLIPQRGDGPAVEKIEIEPTGPSIPVGIPFGPPQLDYCARWPHQDDSGGRRGQTYCDNGGFEDGNFNEWEGRYSKPNWKGKKSKFRDGFILGAAPNARHTIMHAADGNDPHCGQPVVAPGSTYSAKLGNDQSGDESEILMRQLKVTATNAQFRFNFAVVLNDGGHDASEQPAFEVRVLKGKDGNGFADIFHPEIYKREFVADATDPLFYNNGGDRLCTPWRCHVIDLSAYIDEWVTIVFQTQDCRQSAHWGYAYIDSVCGDAELSSAGAVDLQIDTNICPSGAGIWADGSGSSGTISKHFWSVQEATGGWVGIGPEVSEWFNGAPGVFDVQAFAEGKGLPMRCGRHYRVKLALTNECATWTDQTKLIYLDCPVINAGQDQFICLGESVNLNLVGALPPSYNFLGWTTSTGTAVSGSVATTVSPTTSTTYIATVEDTADNGCRGWDDVYIGVTALPVTKVVILHKGTCDCTNRRILTAYAWGKESEPGTSFLWSTGETTPTITVDNPPTDNYQVTYWVTVSNACGSATDVTTVEEIASPLSFFAPNAFFPGRTSNGVFTVWHAGTSAGVRPSYGRYTTWRVFDRWGGIIHQMTATCDPTYAQTMGVTASQYPNGYLSWDGKYWTTNWLGWNVQRTIPSGVYDYTLEYDDKCDGSPPVTEAYHMTALR